MTRVLSRTSRARGIAQVLEDWSRDGRIAGGVVLLSRGGGVPDCAVAGWADREAGQPMRRDTVLRYASMTKLVVSVLALRLVDDGILSLDAPVTRWLPWFRPALPGGSRPAISLLQVMSHTAGLGYRFELPPGNAYERAGVSDGLDCAAFDLRENLLRLASVPLFAAPGTAWRYSLATEVLGAIIEAVCREPLSGVVARRVLAPLGIVRSGFPARVGATVSPEVAPAYWPEGAGAARLSGDGWYDVEGGRLRLSEARARGEGRWDSAGAGMVGTADDFMRLLLCLRAGGAPVLTPGSVARLTTDATGGLPIGTRGPGWGFGAGPVILSDPDRAGLPQGRGTWGWCGVHGGHYWVDPQNDLVLVALSNTGVRGAWGAFADELVGAALAEDRRILNGLTPDHLMLPKRSR